MQAELKVALGRIIGQVYAVQKKLDMLQVDDAVFFGVLHGVEPALDEALGLPEPQTPDGVDADEDSVEQDAALGTEFAAYGQVADVRRVLPDASGPRAGYDLLEMSGVRSRVTLAVVLQYLYLRGESREAIKQAWRTGPCEIHPIDNWDSAE
jgi:hypothetical protein